MEEKKMAARRKGCLGPLVSALFAGVVAPVLVNYVSHKLEEADPHDRPEATRPDSTYHKPAWAPVAAEGGAEATPAESGPPVRGARRVGKESGR
jgi:hypothetical protein